MNILHIADLHLGVETYGKTNPETGINSRIQDFYDTLVGLTSRLDYDVCLIAGDVYHKASPSPACQQLFHKFLSEQETPTVVVAGNHDMTSSLRGITALTPLRTLDIPNLYVADKACVFRLQIKGEWLQVACYPWTNGDKEKIIQKLDSACKSYPGMTTVFLGHLTLDQATLSGSEISIGEHAGDAHTINGMAYESAPWCYVALGHIHKKQAFEKNGITVAYSGSIDCLNQGERSDKKGGYLLTLEDQKLKSIRPVASESREFYNIMIRDMSDLEKIDERINGAIVRVGYEPSVSYAWVKRTLDKFQPYNLSIYENVPRKERKRKLPEGTDVGSLTESQMLDLYLKTTSLSGQERMVVLKAGTKLIRENA